MWRHLDDLRCPSCGSGRVLTNWHEDDELTTLQPARDVTAHWHHTCQRCGHSWRTAPDWGFVVSRP